MWRVGLTPRATFFSLNLEVRNFASVATPSDQGSPAFPFCMLALQAGYRIHTYTEVFYPALLLSALRPELKFPILQFILMRDEGNQWCGETWLSHSEPSLLFQRTGVLFPAPPCQLPITCNSILRDLMLLSDPIRHRAHTWGTYACVGKALRQNLK